MPLTQPVQAHTQIARPVKAHVLHVVESLEVGGLERLVHDMVLGRGRERTSVACLWSAGPFAEDLSSQGIEVKVIDGTGRALPTVWKLWKHLRRVRPDVIHCHNFSACLHSGLAARLAGDIPVVMTKHGIRIPSSGMAIRLNRWLMRHMHLVGVSPEAEKVVRDWLPPDSRPVHYIPNGISTTPYAALPTQEQARKSLGLPLQPLIIGIVARLRKIKGHLLLFDVLERLLTKHPDALLLVIGEGPTFPALRERVEQRGLQKSVMLLGNRRDVPMLLATMDIFCLPSEMEGMPMTVLEAMAAAVPVVATEVGGIPEIVDPGTTGLLVPPRNEADLEQALMTLAGDPQLRRQMGWAGREKLNRQFSLETCLAAYEELYEEAIRMRGPS